MLVKMLAGFVGTDTDWPSGSEQNIETAEALRLIEGGYAVPVAERKAERAVAKPVAERR